MQFATEDTVHLPQSMQRVAFAALPETKCLGLGLSLAPRNAILDWLCARLDLQMPTRIGFANGRCAHAAAADPIYRSALCTADAVLGNGFGMALAMRLRGRRLPAGLYAGSLIPALCRRIAAQGHGVYLVGGAPGIAKSASEALRRAVPGLIIAGTWHGTLRDEDEQRLVRSINASGAAIVLVGEGAVQPDVWLARNAMRLGATLTMGVGRLLDCLTAGRSCANKAVYANGPAGSGARHDEYIEAIPCHNGCDGDQTGLSWMQVCAVPCAVPNWRICVFEHRSGTAPCGREQRSAETARQLAAKAHLTAHVWASLPAAPHPSAWH